MPLPASGLSKDEVLARLTAMRSDDKDWRAGRCFGLVFHAGEDVEEVAREASTLYLSENGLNPLAFPSLGRMQHEVVEICADLFHGHHSGATAAGFMTSGGTESILLAVKAARNRARAERGVTEPEIVVAESAHAAFHKAGEYFGVKVRKVPVRPDWRADVESMAAAMNDDTVLVVGSAPQYPQGVVDPIPELAALAAASDVSCHVDACMGGFVLPFAERLGYPVPPWDFRVEGVTSISADVHKLGYAPKGASVLLHRNEDLRRHHVFVFDDWLGGFYASPGIAGSKPAGPIAAAWAVLHYVGEAGYLRLTEVTLEATRRLVDGVRAIPGLTVLGRPESQCVAISAASGSDVDVFAVMDVLAERGWQLDRQAPPDSLHATVSAGTAASIDDFLADLRASVDAVGATRTTDRSTDYAPLEKARAVLASLHGVFCGAATPEQPYRTSGATCSPRMAALSGSDESIGPRTTHSAPASRYRTIASARRSGPPTSTPGEGSSRVRLRSAAASVSPATTRPAHDTVKWRGAVSRCSRTARSSRANRSGCAPHRFHPSARAAASTRTA
ncbi:MAG TPA: aspartate aminotransferase family protein [Acidimicrobiia bacterium]